MTGVRDRRTRLSGPGIPEEAVMVPLILIGAVGLVIFMAASGMVRRPGERKVVMEKHLIGDHDDHRRYRS